MEFRRFVSNRNGEDVYHNYVSSALLREESVIGCDQFCAFSPISDGAKVRRVFFFLSRDVSGDSDLEVSPQCSKPSYLTFARASN